VSNVKLKYGILFTLIAIVVGLMLFGDNSNNQSTNPTPVVLLTPTVAPTNTPPPVPDKVAVCNFAPNPIWDGIFVYGNLNPMPQGEKDSWKNLDNSRVNVNSNEDLQRYVGSILSQITNSSAGTPLWIVGIWLSSHRQEFAIEVVPEFSEPNANAAFNVREDGSSALQIKQSFLTDQFAMSVAFTIAHELAHASYYLANKSMLPPQTFCGEYQQYSVAMATYLSTRPQYEDADYDVWLHATTSEYWWLGSKWVEAIETHVDQTAH
jgi:hypothetical protein